MIINAFKDKIFPPNFSKEFDYNFDEDEDRVFTSEDFDGEFKNYTPEDFDVDKIYTLHRSSLSKNPDANTIDGLNELLENTENDIDSDIIREYFHYNSLRELLSYLNTSRGKRLHKTQVNSIKDRLETLKMALNICLRMKTKFNSGSYWKNY